MNFKDYLMMTLINSIFKVNININKKLNFKPIKRIVPDLDIIQVKFIFKIIKLNLKDSAILIILIKREKMAQNLHKVKEATFTKELMQ